MVVLTLVLLVLLTVAIVALFAMMGELASKVEAFRGGSYPEMTDWADSLDGISFDGAPTWWPEPLAYLKDAPYGVVVVLSSSCRSCSYFADGELGQLDPLNPAFVLSCPSADRGRAFLEHHSNLASQTALFIDDGGNWSREQLGLDVSPSAVLVERGEPIAAFTMSSPKELATVLHDRIGMRREVS